MTRYLDKPRTVSQIAELMGVSPRPLYHHIRVLHKCGVVELVYKDHRRGSFEEKYFRLTPWFLEQMMSEPEDEMDDSCREALEICLLADEYDDALIQGQEVIGCAVKMAFSIEKEKVPEFMEKLRDGIDEVFLEYGTSAEAFNNGSTVTVGMIGMRSQV